MVTPVTVTCSPWNAASAEELADFETDVRGLERVSFR